MNRTILIDADQMMFMKINKEEDIKEKCENYISRVCNSFGITEYALILSSKISYRKIEFSDYKENRKDTELPEFYHKIKQHLYDNYNINEVEGEEADDVILYLKRLDPKKYNIASQDKDVLYAVAGNHLNTHYKNYGIINISVDKCDLFYNTQLLCGDEIDGVGRLEINGDIIKRFKLRPNNKMTPLTAGKIIERGKSEGMTYNQTVITCYLMAGKKIEDYFNQIKKIYMGSRSMDIELKTNEVDELTLESNFKSDFILQFGKYKGRLISEVFFEDKSYVTWSIDTITGYGYKEKCMKFIDDNGLISDIKLVQPKKEFPFVKNFNEFMDLPTNVEYTQEGTRSYMVIDHKRKKYNFYINTNAYDCLESIKNLTAGKSIRSHINKFGLYSLDIEYIDVDIDQEIIDEIHEEFTKEGGYNVGTRIKQGIGREKKKKFEGIMNKKGYTLF